ncbi:MAG: putative 2OG-Fe(II) oxygenase [Pelagibacterales bacterium]|nr:putative 2OG-Fe(II) oxygenase [Pelagibacterales bacterium]
MKVIKPFGPTIGITKLTKTTVNKLNSFSEKVVGSKNLTKKYDFDSQLIGSMKQQFRVPQKVLKSGIENIIKKSIKDYYRKTLSIKVKKIRIDKVWVVSQYAGDFNPPHLHRGNISGVGYLKVPSSIKNNKEKDLAGLISFFDGRVSLPRNSPPLVKHRETFKPKVGDFYIFPAFLMHEVHPFRGEGERRCFSFNAFVDA